jgi:hypothetical protein
VIRINGDSTVLLPAIRAESGCEKNPSHQAMSVQAADARTGSMQRPIFYLTINSPFAIHWPSESEFLSLSFFT